VYFDGLLKRARSKNEGSPKGTRYLPFCRLGMTEGREKAKASGEIVKGKNCRQRFSQICCKAVTETESPGS